MRLLTVITLVSCLAFALRAEEPAPRQPAPKPEVGVRAAGLPVPSSFKFNSSTGAAKPYMAAPVGQALTADGAGKSSWAFI